MTKTKQKTIKLIFTPALSPGNEGQFDADRSDLFVALNGRSDIMSSLIASDQAKADATIAEYSTQPITGRAHTIVAGYSQVAANNIRVACGIFSIGLNTADKMEARRVTIPISGSQFRGDLTKLATLLRCRVDNFLATHPDTAIAEIEILCRKEQVNRLKEAMEPNVQLCKSCFQT